MGHSVDQPETGQDLHIDALDGLRGLAVMTVVLSHFTNETGLLEKAFGQGAGKIGVMVFFMLSGLLMAYLYFPLRPGGKMIATFFIRRVARVAPLYLLVVVVVFLLFAALEIGITGYDVTRANLIPHLAFLEGDGILWTIPVEFQFYLIFPLLWFGVSRIGPVFGWAILALIVASCVFPVPGAFGLLPFVQVFLVGVLIQLVAERIPPLPGWTVPVLLAIYVLTMPMMLEKYGFPRFRPNEYFVSPFYLALIALLVIVSLKATSSQIILGNPLARWAGRVSYSAYLLHYPIIAIVQHLVPGLNIGVRLIIVLVAVAAASELSFRGIESPARRYIGSLQPVRRIDPVQRA